MEPLRVQIDLLHLGLGDFATGRVLPAIQTTRHGQAFRGRGPGDELHDRLVVPERFAAPVRRNEGEEPVFDLVPFARARREVTHGDGHAGVVRQRCSSTFKSRNRHPLLPPASAVIRSSSRHGIEPVPFVTPPAADRGHRKGARIVIGAEIDEPGVPPEIIDARRDRRGGSAGWGNRAPAPHAAAWRDAIAARHSRSSR